MFCLLHYVCYGTFFLKIGLRDIIGCVCGRKRERMKSIVYRSLQYCTAVAYTSKLASTQRDLQQVQHMQTFAVCARVVLADWLCLAFANNCTFDSKPT